MKEALAEGPAGGRAWWLHADDGTRLRAGLWGQAAKGTVLLFPGRTEYIEKYGRTAAELAERGYATLVIDWRGQGLADHVGRDPMVGHVGRFADFQRDVAALMGLVRALGLAGPLFLLAHSMGGCIGLRALRNGLPVRAAAFSGPMWGIGVKPHLRPVAWVLTTLARLTGQGQAYAPGTGPTVYTRDAPFADNVLTTDPDMWAYMARQTREEPGFHLGGPSMQWVNEALFEMARLRRGPFPAVPSLIGLGLRERVVNPLAVRQVAGRWPEGRLLEVPGAEHEILMEAPAIRAGFLDAVVAHFDAKGR